MLIILTILVILVGPAWSDVAWAQNTFPSSGNVGIGTSNPRGPLHILSPAAAPAGLPASENGLLLGTEGPAALKWVQSYGGPLALNPRGNNVGIGRANPTDRLDVGGPMRIRASGSTNLLVRGEADDVYVDLVKETSLTPAARLEFEGYADQARHEGEIAFFTRGPSTNALVERMRIGSQGYITIGSGVGAVHVSDLGVTLINPSFSLIHNVTRTDACIFDLGGGYITIAYCMSAAEYAPTTDVGAGLPEAGDLVSIVSDLENPLGDVHAPFMLAKSSRPCDPQLLGVIGAPKDGASGGKLNESYLPLAVYGYFPVKVTQENGAIRRGDPITSSSNPGYGMKATGTCRTVGYALEDADRPGSIQVLASLGDHHDQDKEVLALVQDLEARVRRLEVRLNRDRPEASKAVENLGTPAAP